MFDPQLSKRFGYGIVGIRSDILILNASTGQGSPFTSDPGADWGPVWSPDGRDIVFSSNRRGHLELYRKHAAGEGPEDLLFAANGTNPIAQSWSPDGELLVYQVFDPKTNLDLWLLPMKGTDRTPVPLVRTEFREEQGQISPDGRWLAYTSDESGRSEVYVQRFPVASDSRRISTNGGGDPRWRCDGKELFYVAADRQLMAVTVETGASFKHGGAVQLFDTGMPPRWYEARNLYDVSRDGRFLFMAPIEDDRSSPFTVVVNWAPIAKK